MVALIAGMDMKGRKKLMNDDLISRKAVIEAVDRHTKEDGTLDDDISAILEEVNTAFNKEKVLQELKGGVTLLIHGPMLSGKYIKKEIAINIVEKGGIE